MATLMFWNKQNNANQNQNDTKNGKKNWLHAPDALVNGHVAYLVKFLGSTSVDQAKGIETVKDAIRRLQFNQQIKKNESNGNVKTKKVEITISVDGVAVQEPRAQKVLHQFPLHNISYCADEKGVKKFFSFIAKTNNSVPNGDTTTSINNHTGEAESHKCFVFISSKLASDITLTIGQAFELAYRRYMTDSGKETEISKLQNHNKYLESTVSAYRQRLKELIEVLPKSDLDKLLQRHGIRDILETPPQENGLLNNHVASINGSKTPDLGIDLTPNNDDQLLIETTSKHFAPVVPPRNIQNQINSTFEALKPSVGTKLEGLLLNSDSDSDFDPRADESESSNNSSHINGSNNKISNDFFGFEPPKTIGQQLFTASTLPTNHNNNLSMTNGVNGNGHQLSPTPLLAPPPKAAIPRRSAAPQTNLNNNNNINNNNNLINSNNNLINNNSSQDLFGSTPFNAMQSSPFDASIGYGTLSNISSNSSFDTLSSSLSFSTATSTVHSSTSNNNLNEFVPNPFNDSGLNEGEPVANPKFDCLDGNFLQHNTGTITTSTLNAEFHNPFMAINNRNNTMSPVAAVNPFGEHNITINSAEANLSSSGFGSNYDAFRSSTLDLSPPANGNSNIMNYYSSPKAPSTIEKCTSPIDSNLFKDAAAAAFSEFGSSKKPKHEFPTNNKLADSNIAFNMDCSSSSSNKSNNFGFDGKNNFNKTIAFSTDDFTLESLDPLRK